MRAGVKLMSSSRPRRDASSDKPWLIESCPAVSNTMSNRRRSDVRVSRL
jgi:hypothetical protein